MIKIAMPLTLPGEANLRYQDLSYSELKRGYRIIGGDQGDLHFDGFSIENGSTLLTNPRLSTTLDLNQDEAWEIAYDILMFSFQSIGLETVEHS